MPMGENMCPGGRSRYFSIFRSSAFAATFLGSWVENKVYDGASVSGQVASHTSRQPDFHGASVTPSGLLPSDLERPDGSSLEGA